MTNFEENARRLLEERALRLVQLIELAAPPRTISQCAFGILKAALAVYPAEMGEVLTGFMLSQFRRDLCYCENPACDNTVPTTSGLCSNCERRNQGTQDFYAGGKGGKPQ